MIELIKRMARQGWISCPDCYSQDIHIDVKPITGSFVRCEECGKRASGGVKTKTSKLAGLGEGAEDR